MRDGAGIDSGLKKMFNQDPSFRLIDTKMVLLNVCI